METKGFFYSDHSQIKFKEWDTNCRSPMLGQTTTICTVRNTKKRDKMIDALNKQIGANLEHKKKYEAVKL